ncbi:MAG: glycosyltransferase, partial [Polyangiaceae bacterium]
GVSAQIQDGVNGVLLAPGNRDSNRDGRNREIVTGNREAEADEAYGRAVLELLADPERRGRLGKMAAKIAREKASPRVVEAKLADAFQSAQDHAAACGLKPALSRPRPLQWYTTFQHFRPWTAVMGGIYLFGHLRPAKHTKRERMHPQIGT